MPGILLYPAMNCCDFFKLWASALSMCKILSEITEVSLLQRLRFAYRTHFLETSMSIYLFHFTLMHMRRRAGGWMIWLVQQAMSLESLFSGIILPSELSWSWTIKLCDIAGRKNQGFPVKAQPLIREVTCLQGRCWLQPRHNVWT